MAKFFDNFWGYLHTTATVKYTFTWRHLIIFFAVMFYIMLFSMLFCRKEQKTQKIFLILSAVFLLVLEIIRMVWNQQMLKASGETLTFWNITEMDLFRLTLWVSIPAILIGAIAGRDKKFSQFMLNFVFSVAAVAAIFDILAPAALDGSHYHIYHFINLEYLISRATVITVAMSIASTNWLDNSIDDMWMAILSLVVIVGLGVAIYFASNELVDVIYVASCPIIEAAGIYIASPWHLTVVAVFFFGAQVMMYLPFDIYNRKKGK